MMAFLRAALSFAWLDFKAFLDFPFFFVDMVGICLKPPLANYSNNI